MIFCATVYIFIGYVDSEYGDIDSFSSFGVYFRNMYCNYV